MPRSKRLTDLMHALSEGAPVTAETLAQQFGVTPRTIYRDMDALRAAGVSIDGTRGLGYQARHSLTLPPVSLDETELEALYMGLAVIEAGQDVDLARAAARLSERLDDALPDERSRPDNIADAARIAPSDVGKIEVFRAALRSKQKLAASFQNAHHHLRPLALRHWGRLWSFVAWSDSEGHFIEGTLDQLRNLAPLPELFVDEGGKMLENFKAGPKSQKGD